MDNKLENTNITSCIHKLSERCGNCNGTFMEKNDIIIFCTKCQFHDIYVKPNLEDCYIITCNSCNNKICAECNIIGNCVKCDKYLCDDCIDTFWCYQCENGYCIRCEKYVYADHGIYCKTCATKLDKEEF